MERGLAAATTNRRLAALRSVVKLARVLGLIGWTLEVTGLRAEVLKDTRGPGRPGFERMLEQLADRAAAVQGLEDRRLGLGIGIVGRLGAAPVPRVGTVPEPDPCGRPRSTGP